ncbi:MAG: hypothetical protein HY444_04130, partial [Nitrospirae bacterium]|nr:hypothetical protein [Nitrospirota bacterium]
MSPPVPSSKSARGRPALTNEQVLSQVQALLDISSDNLQQVLLKEMLLTVLRLRDAPLDTLDLKILNRTLRELRYAFKVFGQYRDRRKVSIFGSARTQPDDPNYRLATDFARRIVEAGYMVITGGADGIMGAAQAGAHVITVPPPFLDTFVDHKYSRDTVRG